MGTSEPWPALHALRISASRRKGLSRSFRASRNAGGTSRPARRSPIARCTSYRWLDGDYPCPEKATPKPWKPATAAYASETVAKRQRHIAYDRLMRKTVPTMTPADRRFMIEARDAYLASRPLTPEQKDRWKSVFARYPIGELYALFGYSADASGAFPFEIAA